MAIKKNLGMGLDLLLTAAEGKKKLPREEINIGQARDIFDKALQQDEEENFLEAYYLYRILIDFDQEYHLLDKEDGWLLVSQAHNNAAIILYEHGYIERARAYLEKSVAIDPSNQVALNNLGQILAIK